MTAWRHALDLVVRVPRRSIATLVGVTIAAALVTSVLLFGAASGTTVTRRALADVPVDAQVLVSPASGTAALDATAVATAAATVQADPAVRTVIPFDLVHFDRASTDQRGTATQTSNGVLLGLDPRYPSATGLFGLSSGALGAGQIAISRDLASNLGVVPGDAVTFALPGGKTVKLTVSGVVSIDRADLILGPLDASHRAAGANPPTNVAVMNLADLEARVLPLVPAGTQATDPSAAQGAASSAPPQGAVFAPEPAVRRELHVKLDHAQLPGDPVEAQSWLDTVRRRIERQGAGTLTWTDDAAASLEPIAGDLAWGQILFIFLALPGVVLALTLSRLAADATADSTRRHAALLRARGARPRRLAAVFVGATILTAAAGSLIGVATGTALGFALFGSDLTAAGLVSTIVRTGVVAVVLTTLLASLAAALPLRNQLREEIAGDRQELRRDRPPLWQRLGLDVIALIAGVVVYVVAGGTGVHPVLNAEGNPTVTLALTAFLAPFLLWAGGSLLLLRLVSRAVRGSARLGSAMQRVLGPGGALAARSLAARVGSASRAIVVLALAVSFATSVLVFDATYRQQQDVDARLTLGADLRAVPAADATGRPPTTASVAAAAGPGIAGLTPFVDRVVYVGPEAQDLLAIDATTLPSVTPLADTFFAGSTASAAMDALRARPDAILVSAETAKDYSIVPGDHLKIRVPDASGNLKTVTFTMAGIALEFPTAPKDAFLVANLAYVAGQTANDTITSILARSDGDVSASAAALTRRLGPAWTVADLRTTTARLANSITSVDLTTLVAIDVGFGVLIAGVGVLLFLLAGLGERRRELATLVAIGAEPGQLRASIGGETLVVGLAGLAIGLVVGGVVGGALLQILAGIFDPPADRPAVPLATIGVVLAAVAAAVVAALVVADRGLARLGVLAALRER